MRATSLWRLAGIVCLGLTGGSLQAGDAEGRAAIVRLLEIGWATTPQARVAADLQYQEVQRLAAGDPSALTASLLVMMQQRRFDEALKRTDELLAKDESNLTAWRAKAWSAAILKSYPSAMLAADKLSQRLAAEPPKTEADQIQHKELLSFLGRLYGYLGGPAAELANQDQRKAYERQLVARLDETQVPVFEEARDSVLQKFTEMTDAKVDEQSKAVADAEAAKEKTLSDVEADRQKMAERSAELTDRRKQLQDELRAELAEISKLDGPLVTELARLESRAAGINRDLLSYSVEIDRLQAAAARERDPNLRRQLLFEADRLSITASRIEADLIGVNRQAAGVQSERAALSARQQKAQASAGSQMQSIDRELADFAKRERRNDGIEKRTSRQTAGTTSKVRSISAQATALSTYDQFPLEVARQELLDSLR